MSSTGKPKPIGRDVDCSNDESPTPHNTVHAELARTMSHWPRCLAAGGSALLAVAAAPGRASADGPGVVVEWTAPTECPTGEAVRRRIESLTGPGMSVHARAAVTPKAGGYDVLLEVRVADVSGERALTAQTCDEAAE